MSQKGHALHHCNWLWQGGEGGGRGQTIVLGENGLSRGMRMGSMELCFLVFYSGILILYYLIILDQQLCSRLGLLLIFILIVKQRYEGVNIQNNVGRYNEEYAGNLLGPEYVGKCYLGWVNQLFIHFLMVYTRNKSQLTYKGDLPSWGRFFLQ